jgi:6-pyruvoyltetrahydropterin/6-carboxytetrahydropterin synthase
MVTIIRRFVETDTGHRVPNHKSKCKHIHGHRYRWEAEIEGDVILENGVSDEGMVMDFADISEILKKNIHDLVDHAFIVYEKDEKALEALSVLEESHRTVIVPFIPTAENLARWAFEIIEPKIVSKYEQKLRLAAFHVRETPKSWATWRKDH